MKRYAASLLVLGLALLVPVAASAQKDNKYTREATKYIGLAMGQQEPDARKPLYEQALTQLEEGMARDPENAKVWLLAGQTYVGLDRFEEADSAFKMALELHPDYADQITAEREQGWVQAFNIGAGLMGENKYPEAIAALERAEMIYSDRPEGLLNLGALYLNEGDLDKAEAAFEGARKAIVGPLAAKLDSAQQAQWVEFDDMAQINLAQLEGQRGVNYFQAKEYPQAIAAFRKAYALNPYSRDFLFNLSQSIWAQASDIEARIDSLPEAEQEEATKQAAPELVSLYQSLDSVSTDVSRIDPTNELTYVIMARAHRMLGEYSYDPDKLAAAQAEALQLLQERENLPFQLSDIMVSKSGDSASVQCTVKNQSLAAGATAAVKFTLLGIDGQVIGEQVLNIPVPEKDQTSSFEGSIPITGEIAGWEYSLN